jgi:putative lipoic acid-binding regulatory protein
MKDYRWMNDERERMLRAKQELAVESGFYVRSSLQTIGQMMNPDKGSTDSGQWWENFQRLLESELDWPGEYVFKFIVPKRQLEEMKSVFEGERIVVRASSAGNYLSVTAKLQVDTSDDVIAIYTAAGEIEGVISL